MSTLTNIKQPSSSTRRPLERRLEFVTQSGRVFVFYVGCTKVSAYAITELGEMLARTMGGAEEAEQLARARLAEKFGPEADPAQLRRTTAWVQQ